MDCSVLSEIVAISKQNIYKTEYFQRKGYTQKILDKHCLGYLENGLRNYQKYITEDCSILSCYKYVIPNYDRNGNITYIIFRSDKKAVKDTLAFDIDSTYTIGNYNGLIWNEKALFEENPMIFINETWTDALSIIECGYSAIALNRINNITDLWKKIKDSSFLQNKKYILFCDNDYYGKKANDNLKKMLVSLKVHFIEISTFPENIKDANEWFLYNRVDFEKTLRGAINELFREVK